MSFWFSPLRTCNLTTYGILRGCPERSLFHVFKVTPCTMRYALCGNWKWRRIGWKNICKLRLEERTPEELKGEGN